MYTDGLVTKSLSLCGFTARKGAAIIHKDVSATHQVSEVQLDSESGSSHTHYHYIALRIDKESTHAIILIDSISLPQKVTNGMGGPGRNVTKFHICLR